MSSALSSIFDGKPFYHWRMARRGGAYLVGSLAAATAAGVMVAAADHAPRLVGLGLTTQAAFGAFIALAIVAASLWWRFSRLQDEMFHRIQTFSYGWGSAVAIGVLIIWGIAQAAGLTGPINPIAPLLVFAITKSICWMAATRKWL